MWLGHHAPLHDTFLLGLEKNRRRKFTQEALLSYIRELLDMSLFILKEEATLRGENEIV